MAQDLIVSVEGERLEAALTAPDRADHHGVEIFEVLTDDSSSNGFGESLSSLDKEETLGLVYSTAKRGEVLGDWAYRSVPSAFAGERMSGWLLARSNVGARLEGAYFGIGCVVLGIWTLFSIFLLGLYRRLKVASAEKLRKMSDSAGLSVENYPEDVDKSEALIWAAMMANQKTIEAERDEFRSFKAITENTSEGMFLCDPIGNIEWGNASFLSTLGCTLEELKSQKPFAYLQNDRNDPLYMARLSLAMERSDSVSIEFAGIRPDGSEYWASLELKPLKGDGDSSGGFFGVQIDITDQRKASLELEEVSRRFALAMESANVGIWDWDVKKDILIWDEHTYALYGVLGRKFEPSYRSWMGCVDPDHVNRIVRSIDHCLSRGENIDLVLSVRKPDGEESFLKCAGRAFFNEAGEVTRYIGITSDVTSEQRAKLGLIEQKDEAERLAVRLAEAVKLSKKVALEADQATRAKSAFLAMMSHEIRTPMNGVIGMASLLLETELDEFQKDYLNTIRVSGDTLLTLINDILDYSKIESGKLDIEMAPFSIRDCVEEAADLLASKASEKGIELLCLVDTSMPAEVVGDITRLRQVIVNLVGNAIKFTDVGEVEILVRPPTNGKVQFSVRDTGIGIPQDRMNRLFEVFSQVDSSTTRKYGGSGLGLSISKQLTNLMGGEMWVESSPGRGSVFHFDVAFDDVETLPRDPIYDANPEFEHKKALVVESNSVLRNYLGDLCLGWGLEVTTASSLDRLPQSEVAGDVFNYLIVDEAAASYESKEGTERWERIRDSAELSISLRSPGSKLIRDAKTASIIKPCRVASILDTLLSVNRKRRNKKCLVGSSDLVGDSAFSTRLPLRILVADDNSVNQKVARMMLKKFGYSPDLVANGVEAVEAVKQRDYDLIFMDCQMPEMDGFEATRMIRDIESDRSSQKRTFIFALTANVRGEAIEMSKDAGMDGFLAKPIKLDEIKNSLLEVEAVFVSRN